MKPKKGKIDKKLLKRVKRISKLPRPNVWAKDGKKRVIKGPKLTSANVAHFKAVVEDLATKKG